MTPVVPWASRSDSEFTKHRGLYHRGVRSMLRIEFYPPLCRLLRRILKMESALHWRRFLRFARSYSEPKRLGVGQIRSAHTLSTEVIPLLKSAYRNNEHLSISTLPADGANTEQVLASSLVVIEDRLTVTAVATDDIHRLLSRGQLVRWILTRRVSYLTRYRALLRFDSTVSGNYTPSYDGSFLEGHVALSHAHSTSCFPLGGVLDLPQHPAANHA